jgi:uncharacterized protein YciI
MATQEHEHEIRCVIIHRAGKAWDPSVGMFQQPWIVKNPGENRDEETHVGHYRKLLDEGRLALGGPFIEGGAVAGVVVGMMIAVPGVSKDDLETFAADDPAVKSGTLEFEIRQWIVGMKQEALA